MSEAANRGKGDRGGGGGAKRSGGFWSGLVDGFFRGLTIEYSPRPSTEASPRMNPVEEERKEAGEELQYRTTDGAEGRPPMRRIEQQRQHVARSIDARTAPASREARIPQAGGAPLAKETRARMEQQLGADLSDVRVHTGGDSAAAAQSLGARAFAVGSDVHFNHAEFAPGSKEGDKLLAHELTHVVQAQKGGIQRKADAGDDAAGEHGGHEVSSPHDPAEKEADAVAESVTGRLHGEGAAAGGKQPAPAAKLEGVGRKIFRVPSITARPPRIARMAKDEPSTGGMIKTHDSARFEIAGVGKVWGKTKVQDKLRKNPAEKTALEGRKTKIESAFQAKEADFTRLKATPVPAERDALQKIYVDLRSEAATLRQDLEDYTKTVEQIAEEAKTLRSQITGSLDRANKQVPDPDAIKVLQLPSFAGDKQALNDHFAKVKAGVAADDKTPMALPELRKLDGDADKLRRKAEECNKLNDVNNAIIEPVKKIDNLIRDTTKAGRPDAGAGDGSSEAAAIEEAQTGKPTKDVWHGPKCFKYGNDLDEPITTLREIRTTTTDAEMQKTIDGHIERAKTRQTALRNGADVWKKSPHFKKAPF